MSRYELSKFCFLFPEMDADDYAALRESVKECRSRGEGINGSGIREAVIVWRDQDSGTLTIIDGRHRYKVAEELGIECPTVEYGGTPTQAVELVMDRNLNRRHMNQGQKASAAVKAGGLLSIYKNRKKDEQPSGEKNNAYRELGKRIGVSESTVNRAQRILKKAPEKLDEVIAGEKTLQQVHREVTGIDNRKPKEPDRKSRDFLEDEQDQEEVEHEESVSAASEEQEVECDESDDDTPHGRMKKWNAVVNEWAASAVAVGKNPPDGIDQKTLEIIRAHLRSAADSIRAQKGYALCPYCKGDGCNRCGLGWLNRLKYDSIPPSKRGAA